MKKLLGVFAVLAGVLVVPGVSSAAVNITHLTFPGSGPNATLPAGDSVEIKSTFQLTGTSEVESMSYQIVDNLGNDIGMPEVCINVNDRVTAGVFTRSGMFDTTGGTEGTFGLRQRAYGVSGPGTDNNCGGTVLANVFNSNRLTLTEEQNEGEVANNTGNGGGSGNVGSSDPAWLSALLTQMQALIAKLSQPAPAPTKPAYCAELPAKLAGTQYGVYSYANQQLQSFLIANGHVIGYGATSYYGVQTAAAVSAAQAACK